MTPLPGLSQKDAEMEKGDAVRWRNGDYIQVSGGNVHIYLSPGRWQEAAVMACGRVYGLVRCAPAPDPLDFGATGTPCVQCWESM